MTAPTIAVLPQLVDRLSALDRARFERIFHLTAAEGITVPPPEMKGWIEKHFGSLEAVSSQHIVRVTNRLTLEGTMFNVLRASRPLESGPGECSQDIDEAVRGSAGDPFCHPLTGTPADVFGRIRGRHAVTASNIAKCDAWHGVIVFDEHDPLRFGPEQVADYYETAQAWARAAHQVDPEARYPFFLWNCLWRSGASILHGHAQVVVARGMPLGRVELWRRAAAVYRASYGTDYFGDLIAVMRALGLAIDHGAAVLLPALTPFKEKEVQIIAPRLDGDLTSAIYAALRALIDRLGMRSFNVALYQPPLGAVEEGWHDFPFVARLVDRGPLRLATSDVGAAEVFGESVVTTDPYKVAKALSGSKGGME